MKFEDLLVIILIIIFSFLTHDSYYEYQRCSLENYPELTNITGSYSYFFVEDNIESCCFCEDSRSCYSPYCMKLKRNLK